MPLLQLVILAVVAMVGLGTLRLVRVSRGRTPLPDGHGRRLFMVAFVVAPPLVLGALTQPATPAGPLRGMSSLPAYVLIDLALVILMAVAAVVIGQLVHSRSGRLARLALAGSEDDPARDVPSNPPITAQLTKCCEVVDQANAAFPRGPEFPAQVDRAGFRADWDALDSCTQTLERNIATERLLAIGVSAKAEATARDARGRLDTLRLIAVQHGQAWAPDQRAGATILSAG